MPFSEFYYAVACVECMLNSQLTDRIGLLPDYQNQCAQGE